MYLTFFLFHWKSVFSFFTNSMFSVLHWRSGVILEGSRNKTLSQSNHNKKGRNIFLRNPLWKPEPITSRSNFLEGSAFCILQRTTMLAAYATYVVCIIFYFLNLNPLPLRSGSQLSQLKFFLFL